MPAMGADRRGSGHGPHLTHPEEYAKLIVDFVHSAATV